MDIIEEIFNIIAPHECLSCRAEGDLLCEVCATGLIRIPSRCYICRRWAEDYQVCERCRKKSPVTNLYTVTTYEDVLAKKLLYKLKFGRARTAAQTIAQLMAATPISVNDMIVTYVPTANKRIRERGYDQAKAIATLVAKEYGLPCLSLLVRDGDVRQVGQRREIRKQQMKGAFRSIHTALLQRKHILLVDDVLTTGATCEAAARTLRQAGAKRVSAMVFAVA